MSILNRSTLSFCESKFSDTPATELFSRAVCRLPLGIARGQLFAKPPLPSIAESTVCFDRPPLPALVRPLRSVGGLTSAQLNHLFDKVIGHGRFL